MLSLRESKMTSNPSNMTRTVYFFFAKIQIHIKVNSQNLADPAKKYTAFKKTVYEKWKGNEKYEKKSP